VIVLAVRWYLRFALSYRDVEELLAERGVEVDHTTVYRWVQRFTPLLAEAARPCRHAVGARWQVDETYAKVAGHWRYVYRSERSSRTRCACCLIEPVALPADQPKRISQQSYRRATRLANPSRFQISDRPYAQPGPLGQPFLRQQPALPTSAQQPTEACCGQGCVTRALGHARPPHPAASARSFPVSRPGHNGRAAGGQDAITRCASRPQDRPRDRRVKGAVTGIRLPCRPCARRRSAPTHPTDLPVFCRCSAWRMTGLGGLLR
jgi:hypothetical protein